MDSYLDTLCGFIALRNIMYTNLFMVNHFFVIILILQKTITS